MTDTTAPTVTGLAHLSLTVSDIDASLAWYSRVLGWQIQEGRFPHYDREDTGYGVLVKDPASQMIIGLHTNTGNSGESFDEVRTGLDHVSFAVKDRDELEAWVTHLEQLEVEHTGIRDITDPFTFSTVVFRDPDNIQLELMSLD